MSATQTLADRLSVITTFAHHAIRTMPVSTAIPFGRPKTNASRANARPDSGRTEGAEPRDVPAELFRRNPPQGPSRKLALRLHSSRGRRINPGKSPPRKNMRNDRIEPAFHWSPRPNARGVSGARVRVHRPWSRLSLVAPV